MFTSKYYTPIKEIITAIENNGQFVNNKILRPHLMDSLGIRMKFPEGTQLILWTNGKKYHARCEAFGSLFTLIIPQKTGDAIWERFKKEYEGNYSYEDI